MGEEGAEVVLLVEDDPDHAELVTRAMAEHAPGVVLVRLGDGEAALDYLARGAGEGRRSRRPALVLLDLRLPGIDGVEVLRRLRQGTATRDLAVVLLTTADPGTDPGIPRDATTARAVKPADGAGFRRLIGELVERWVRPGASGTAQPPPGVRDVRPSPGG